MARLLRGVFVALLLMSLPPSDAGAAGIQALFDLDAASGGPFPSDRFTVPDVSQNTGLRVNLPKADCAARVSDCEDIEILNKLDGFNVQPRLSIPFTGPIDVGTVSSETVFLLPLGGGPRIGINQVVWDLATNTLHVESDELLDQHTRYVLVVTRDVRDAVGDPVEASGVFQAFRHGRKVGQQDHDPAVTAYRDALLAGLEATVAAGVDLNKVAVASVFTTQSVTAVLEKIRDRIKADTPEPADFLLGPGGTRTLFQLDQMTQLTSRQQARVDPSGFNPPVNVNLGLLRIIPGAVGQLAFGKYSSPDYAAHPGEYIPQVGTRTGVPVVQRTNEIFFNLVVPSGLKPSGGWPVAIFGHGGGGNKNSAMTNVAAVMALHGIATIVINSVGHGFGPFSTLTVTLQDGVSTSFLAGGRGIDQDGNGVIGNPEGMAAAPPRGIIGNRDGFRQTAVDLMQLVRVIEVGIDVDGDSVPDLDPSRIYYFGQSQGGNFGTLLLAVEPGIRVGAPNVPGSPLIDNDRLSASRRPTVGTRLAARVPPLLNAPGITQYGGLPVSTPHFHDNLPLRDDIALAVGLADGTSHIIRSPMTNSVEGAMPIQEFVDNTEWVFQSGSSVAYGRHLRRDPLPGVPAKAVIVQFAKGDLTNPNPVTTAILRAGRLADRATFYRHDLAFEENPQLPKDPHNFLVSIGVAAFRDISLGALSQIAAFLASDGELVIHPEPVRLFEVPIVLPLPEDLGFIP